MFQAHAIVVRDAANVVLRRLQSLPPSDEKSRLYARARDCAQQVEEWASLPPTTRDRDALMTRLLAVHVEVARLERPAAAEMHDAPAAP
jgi:hypothetical protein